LHSTLQSLTAKRGSKKCGPEEFYWLINKGQWLSKACKCPTILKRGRGSRRQFNIAVMSESTLPENIEIKQRTVNEDTLK
jgi:hypothetical protein